MTVAVAAGPAVAGDGLFGRPYRALTTGAVALISLSAFEALAVTTAMPTVAAALDGLALYALAFGGAFAAGVVGMVAAGIRSDARGPAGPLRFGVCWFVAGLLIAGTAPVMSLLVLGRMVQGFGSGMFSVALYVVVARAYPTHLRPRIFAAFAAAWVIPSLVGPAIAGLIVEYVGWRWVFLLVPALALPAFLLIQPALRRLSAPGAAGPDRDRDADPDPAVGRSGQIARLGWAVGAAGSAALLHYGGQQRGATAVVLLGSAFAGLAFCAPRLLPAGLFRARRGLPTVVLLRGLAAAAFVGAEVFIPLALSRERGLSPTGAGLALVVGALAWSGGSWLQGRVRRPTSRATLPRAGMLLIACGIGFAALMVLPAVPVPVAVAGWMAAGLGMGLVYPSLSVLTLELSPAQEQGRNSSALQLGDNLCSATVLALGGTLFAATAATGPGSYLVGFMVAGVLALLGLLIAGRVEPAGGLGAQGRPKVR